MPISPTGVPEAEASMSASEDIQRLLDRVDIEHLKARYCRYHDEHRWDEWRGLFTDDFQFDGTDQPFENIDSYIKMISKTLSDRVTIHHALLPEVEFTGPDSAHGIWTTVDYQLGHADGGDEYAIAIHHGVSYEQYRKLESGWKISRVRTTRKRVQGLLGVAHWER
jgi:SnoaL-like protein